MDRSGDYLSIWAGFVRVTIVVGGAGEKLCWLKGGLYPSLLVSLLAVGALYVLTASSWCIGSH